MFFSFALQGVLDLKTKQMKWAEEQVELSLRRVKELEQMIQKEKELYFKEREQINFCLREGNLPHAFLFEQSLSLRQNQLMLLLKNMRLAKAEAVRCHLALRQAKQSQKSLENLKEIRKKEFDRKIVKQEERALDEFGVKKFLRQQEKNRGEA